jgi:hypothetical protein
LRENILRQPRIFHRADAALDHLLQEERLLASRYFRQESQPLLDLRIDPYRDDLQLVFSGPFHRILLLAF